MNQKNLHKHSLPILLLLSALFVLTASFAARVPNISLADAGQALVAQTVHIERKPNGLARISIGADANVMDANNSDEARDELDAIGKKSGSLTQLNFAVESLQPQNHLPKN